MADVNIKITAQDQASATIQKTARQLEQMDKQMQKVIVQGAGMARGWDIAAGSLLNAGAAMGGLSASAGKLTSEIALMIGAGGIGGLSTSLIRLLPEMLSLGDAFIGWATGLDSIAAGYDKLDPKLKEHTDRLKEIQDQRETMGLAGSARAAIEREQIGRSIKALEEERKIRREALVEAENWLQQYALVPGAIAVFGGRVEKAREALTKVEQGLETLGELAQSADKNLGLETTKEGEERLKKLSDEADKFKKKVEDIDAALSKTFRNIGQTPSVEALGAPPAPVALPEILSPEQLKKTEEGLADVRESWTREAFATTKKYRDKEIDYYYESGTKVLRKIEDMREEAFKEQKRQYERMVDSIRDGAGQIFDAMLTKGESVFSSLAKFGESVLQTMLRNVFQNAIMTISQSSGVLQRLLGGGGAGGGGGGAIAGGSMAALGGLVPFFNRGGGATGGMGPFLGETAVSQTRTGFVTTAAGGALTAGGALAGQMLAMDAFRRGSAIEGLAGGAMAGASIGTMIAPGVGTAIGAGVGAIAGLITGLFGGGAKRRAEEAAKRAAMIEAQQFQAPETISRFGVWGAPGEFAVEPDLTGRIRGIGKQPTVVNNIDVSMIDARHAKEAGSVIANIVSQQILGGGNLLAYDIAWAAS